MSGMETPLCGPDPTWLPKKFFWVVRMERYPPLLRVKILIGNW